MGCGMGCMTKLDGGGMLVDKAGIIPSGRLDSSGEERSSSRDPNSFSSFSRSSSEARG